MTDIKTFVLLKYEIITSNQDTWQRCETYPESVNKRWVLRCARDVEHIDKTGSAKRCNDLTERYIDGEIEVLEELKKAADVAYATAAYYAAYAAFVAYNAYAAYAAYAAFAAYNAYAAYADANSAIAQNREERWKLYIGWLIEELCKYEEKQNDRY